VGERQRSDLLRWLVLGAFLLPIVWAVLGSLDITPDGRGGWVVAPTLDHYREVLTGSLGLTEATIQGLLVAGAAATLAVGAGLLGAVGLRGVRSAWASRAPAVLLVLSLIPPIAYGPPLVDETRALGLFDSPVGLTVVEAGLGLPFALWVLASYLSSVPREIDEAGALDGCGALGHLRWIVLPMVWPALVATLVVLFVLCWNLFEIPSLLAFASIQTVQIVLSSFVSYEKEMEWPTAAASLVVGMLPAFFAVALGQRLLRSFSPFGQEGGD